ncbi:exonuclease domain-containing protein [Streptococcus suis]|uniref:exonuclease domain-containing protein n=1 Tax=Streptococcus suis TaxID=1307 RepID=UPI0009455240|nr:exonuclease domain-containing protein [Streptococcus suis]
MTNSYVALDFETANNFRRSVCSIGLAKFIDGELTDTYYALINPQEEFGWKQKQIHGITQEDIVNSPTFPEIYDAILTFIGELPIVVHNLNFDLVCFRKVCEKYDLKFPQNSWYCTYRMSKIASPREINHGLEWLSYKFGIELEHHNALSDAIACGKLYQVLSANTDALTPPLTSQTLPSDNKIFGSFFCFSGTLQYFTKEEAGSIIEAHGGVYQKNLTQRTNYLVIGNFRPAELEKGGTGKFKKASELLNSGSKIEILSESDFLQLLD